MVGLSMQVQAAFVWEGGPNNSGLTIHSYRYYWDGTNTYVELEFEDPISLTGCAASIYNSSTNPYPKVAHVQAATTVNSHSEYALQTATAAFAQGLKIKILYDSTRCNTESGYMLLGIKVLPAS